MRNYIKLTGQIVRITLVEPGLYGLHDKDSMLVMTADAPYKLSSYAFDCGAKEVVHEYPQHI